MSITIITTGANRWSRLLLLALACVFCTTAQAQQTWKPTRPITIIVPNAAAGTSDRTARELQRIMQAHKLVEVPVVVVNRPGGSGTIGLNQLHATPGDAHVFLIMNGATLSGHITGLTPYSHAEFTPLPLMVDEYFGVNVRSDSTVKSAQDMLDRLRKTPDALTFGTASLAGSNFTSLAAALKTAGIDVKRLKAVSFAGGSEISMALLGGHIDITSTGLGNMASYLQQGKMRTLVMSGPQRMWGPFADVPTWKEVGVNAVASGWRGALGPQGLTPAQIAFWDGVFRKVMETPEWKEELRDNYWVSTPVSAAEVRRQLDAEYAELKQIITELGRAKPAK